MRVDGFEDVSLMLRPGVYLLLYRGAVVYVGKSKSMLGRIYAHKNLWAEGRKKAAPAWLPIKGVLFDQILIRPCALEDLDALEQEMIARYKPRLNTQHVKVQGTLPKGFVASMLKQPGVTFVAPQEERLVRRV